MAKVGEVCRKPAGPRQHAGRARPAPDDGSALPLRRRPSHATNAGRSRAKGSTALTGPCDRRTWPAFPRPKAHDALPAQGPVALRRAHPARPCRPRSGPAARLRQHADLPRLDGALSEHRRLPCTAAARYTYGTKGTPTTEALESAWTALAGAAGTVLAPSGLAAVTLALMSCLKAGDHLLVTDSVYRPTRQFCDGVLKALRRRDDLLRPGARRRHRGAAAAEHHGGVHRGPGFAILRDAGHPGHRRGGAPARRRRAHGQHLGDAAAVPAARARRRSRDRGRNQIPVGQLGPAARARVGERPHLAGVAAHLRQLRHVRRTGGRLPGPARLADAWRCASRSTSVRRSTWRAGWRPARRSPACSTRRSRAIPATRSGSATSRARRGCSRSCSSRRRRGPWRRCSTASSCSGSAPPGAASRASRSRSTAPPTAPPRAGSPPGPAVRLHIGLEDLDDLKADLDAGFARLRREAAKAA